MVYKIGTRGNRAVLTMTPDLSINSLDLAQTEVILHRMMASPIMAVVLNLDDVVCLTFRGSCAILQIVSHAKTQGLSVFLSNVQPSIHPLLAEIGAMDMVRLIESKEDLELALREERTATAV
ncbi:MAG: hypothetical protein WD425_07490 [Nitrospirales bacterium]